MGKLLDVFQRATTVMGAGFLLLITGLIVAQVIWRGGGFSIGFSAPLISVLIVWLSYLLVGSVARRDEHVRIGYVIERLLGRRAKPVYQTVENVFSIGICFFLIYAGYLLIASYMETGQQYMFWPSAAAGGGFKYGYWINVIVIPLGFFIALLFYVERIRNQIRSLRGRKKGERSAVSGGENSEKS